MNIIIYTIRETLKHKQGADGYQRYYWNFSRPPKRLEEGDRIYFADRKSVVQGKSVDLGGRRIIKKNKQKKKRKIQKKQKKK